MAKVKFTVLLIILTVTGVLPLRGEGQGKSFSGSVSVGHGKVRVGYIESERYESFGLYLNGIAEGLQKIGVISGYNIRGNSSDSVIVWNALSRCVSDHFIFIKDSFFNLKDMPEKEYCPHRLQTVKR